MAKRRQNNPLPNWHEGIKPESQERWIPEETSDDTSPVNEVSDDTSPTTQYKLGDELNRGVTAEWWRMAQCRAKAKAKWGNGRVNARAVEAETLRLYRQSNW